MIYAPPSSKWLRKFHRWIAAPTALAILAAVAIKFVGDSQIVAAWEELDKIPSILMMIMAISGAYLFLLPYIIKGQRKNKHAPTQTANGQLQQES